MNSDSDRKAAEEYCQNATGNIGIRYYGQENFTENPLIMAFLHGIAHAKKDLEQVAQNIYRAGWYTAASYEHPAFLEESVFVKEFEDYWQKKTESKEGE
jgi:hypothetical protein